MIYGGVSQKPQEMVLKKGIDILIATPGRLGDLMQQRLVDLRHVEILTLDEADRMLDLGFIHAVKKIIAETPRNKQTLFFSATMPEQVAELSGTLLVDPVKVEVTPESPTVDAIEQSVYYVDKENKRRLLLYLLKDPTIVSALVFTRTKHGADRVARELIKGNIRAQAIHGNKSQTARQQALSSFKNKETRVLVATDIAARGLDIDELSHVINFDLPEVPETYIHRIGRTGRAGHSGISISFCDFGEKKSLESLEKLCARRIPLVKDHPYPLLNTTVTPKSAVSGRNASGQQTRQSQKASPEQRNRRKAKPSGSREGNYKPYKG